jgi:hypothetical protein
VSNARTLQDEEGEGDADAYGEKDVGEEGEYTHGGGYYEQGVCVCVFVCVCVCVCVCV